MRTPGASSGAAPDRRWSRLVIGRSTSGAPRSLTPGWELLMRNTLPSGSVKTTWRAS